MRLTNVALTNFRPFARADFEVPADGLTVVLGANNAGKSALVSALDVIAGGSVGDAQRHGSDSPMHVRADFLLTPEEIARFTAPLHEAGESFADGAFSKVRLTFMETPSRVSFLSKVEWSRSATELVSVAEMTFDPTTNNFKQFAIPTNTPLSKIGEGPLQERVQHAGSPVPLETVLELVGLAGLIREWQGSLYHFAPTRGVSSQSVPMSVAPILSRTGDNAGQVLLDLRHNQTEKWVEFTRLLTELLPGAGELQLPAQGSNMEIGFGQGSDFVNLTNMGTGVGQLLLTLILGVTHSPTGMLILEEPETALHPSAQRALSNLLAVWSTDRPIVITTHSTTFMGTGASTSVLLVERTLATSTVRSIESEWVDVAEALGMQLIDALVADRLLIVEGPSDEAALETWFPAIRTDPRIAVIQAAGGNASWRTREFSSWLDQVERAQKRRVLFLRDRDEIPASIVDRLQKPGVVSVLPVRELENFFLDGPALADYLETLDGRQRDVEAVEESLRECAAGLLATSILRTVAREQETIRLCDDKARSELVAAGAGLEEFVARILEVLPDPEVLKGEVSRRWEEISADLSSRWTDEWRSLAPGSDVLDCLFMKEVGRRYKKIDDAVPLASRVRAPEALDLLLRPLVSSVPD